MAQRAAGYWKYVANAIVEGEEKRCITHNAYVMHLGGASSPLVSCLTYVYFSFGYPHDEYKRNAYQKENANPQEHVHVGE